MIKHYTQALSSAMHNQTRAPPRPYPTFFEPVVSNQSFRVPGAFFGVPKAVSKTPLQNVARVQTQIIVCGVPWIFLKTHRGIGQIRQKLIGQMHRCEEKGRSMAEHSHDWPAVFPELASASAMASEISGGSLDRSMVVTRM